MELFASEKPFSLVVKLKLAPDLGLFICKIIGFAVPGLIGLSSHSIPEEDRFVKSNSIVLSQNFKTIGIGSGQPSRLDSCLIAIEKMKKNRLKNNNDEICAASDAFFPFLDGFEKLVQAGATAIIQPFGSIRDKEIIKFANKMGIVLIFSKTRHFRH